MEPMKPMKPMPAMKPMTPLSTPEADWWPAGLKNPSSTGSQGPLRYAFFPADRRLVVDLAGDVQQYDTGDHVIQGVSQRGHGSATTGVPQFTSQHGKVDLTQLRPIKS